MKTLNRRALRLPKAVDELIIEEEQAELLRKAIAAPARNSKAAFPYSIMSMNITIMK